MPRPSTTGMSHIYIGADLSPDEVEFGRAMDTYKRRNHKPYPTFSEVLWVLRSLGYRKVAAPEPLPSPEEIQQRRRSANASDV